MDFQEYRGLIIFYDTDFYFVWEYYIIRFKKLSVNCFHHKAQTTNKLLSFVYISTSDSFTCLSQLFISSLSRRTLLRGTYAHSRLEFKDGWWKKWLLLSVKAIKDCGCQVLCGFLLSLVFTPCFITTVLLWVLFHRLLPSLPASAHLRRTSQALPKSCLTSFLALPWLLFSPRSLPFFFLLSFLFPSPIGRWMYIYCYPRVYMQRDMCKFL